MDRQKSHHSKIMFEMLYTVLVPPVHKITSFAKFNSIMITRSSFKPYGQMGGLKNQNLMVLQTFYFTSF